MNNETKASQPKKSLGLWLLTALVAGNMIGSGVFVLPAALAHFGTLSLVAWALTAVGATVLALLFANFSRLSPAAGGPYAYCRAGLGDLMGFLVAYSYWIALWVGNAAIVVALVGYLSVFWPALSHNHWLSFQVSVAILWLLTFINARGTREAGIVQLVTTILKLLPLLAVAGFGLFHVHLPYLKQFNTSGMPTGSAIFAAAAVTFWAFIGLESATVPADDVDQPERTIPLATILGTLIAAVVYLAGGLAIMGMIPVSELAHSVAPFADAAEKLFGVWGRDLIAVGAVISSLGALNGWVLLQAQIPAAAAKDGLFPQFFGKKNKQGVPTLGLYLSSVLITILLYMSSNQALVAQFTLIILLATLATVIPYFLTAISQLVVIARNREHRKKKAWIIIAILASIYAFGLIVASGKEIVFYGSLLFFSGFPLYVLRIWKNPEA